MNTAKGFFAFLDERFSAASGGCEELWLSIRGYRVRLLFRGISPGRVTRANLAYLASMPAPAADETVCVWEDDLDTLMQASMIPVDQRFIHYHQTADWHVLFPGKVGRMGVRDNASQVTYVCFEPTGELPESYVNKPFVNEIQWWLWDRYLLLHGAAVGAGGHGALITAPSGKGKSTLALSCLLAGMDFVAEDYVLVDRSGPAVGHPILGTGFLTASTLEMLPELKADVLYHATIRDKFLVDLAARGGCFRDSLSLDAMVYPVVCAADEPRIEPARSLQPFMASLTTTAKQIKSQERFADSFKVLFQRMKTIPAYQMDLSSDVSANARALRDFLLGLGQGR